MKGPSGNCFFLFLSNILVLVLFPGLLRDLLRSPSKVKSKKNHLWYGLQGDLLRFDSSKHDVGLIGALTIGRKG